MTKPDAIHVATAEAFARYPLAKDGCVVAVSGGPDSVALLHAVADYFLASQGSGPFIVAHLNHCLRGEESDQDEEFVRSLTTKMAAQAPQVNIHFAGKRVDVADHAGRLKMNLEAAARHLRYAWLAEQARSKSVRWVLTAHNLNDQAETVLFHMLRGTGIRGLRGMRPRRCLDGNTWLLRPWLGVERQEILAYLSSRKLEFRMDSSNLELTYSRNRIRRDLIPKLQAEYNPRIQEALAALSHHAAHACHLLNAELRKTLKQVEMARVAELVILKREAVQTLSLELLASLYAYIWKREGWPRNRMGRREWAMLAHWTQSQSKAIDMPDGIRAVKKRFVVQLGPRK
jgi:tRNA(Ile)-lysidine synthase